MNGQICTSVKKGEKNCVEFWDFLLQKEYFITRNLIKSSVSLELYTLYDHSFDTATLPFDFSLNNTIMFFLEIVICRCSTKLMFLKKFLKIHRKNTGKTVLFCEFGNDFNNNIFIRHHGATASIFWADDFWRSRHNTRIELTTFYCGLCLVICLVLIMFSSVFQKCYHNLSLAALIFYFTFVFALVLRIFASY